MAPIRVALLGGVVLLEEVRHLWGGLQALLGMTVGLCVAQGLSELFRILPLSLLL